MELERKGREIVRGGGMKFSFSKKQKVYLFFKRAIDLFGSFLGIVILGIPMLLLALITVCTSKGPALYKQTRLGKNEKPFTLLKFRSMVVGAPVQGPLDFKPGEKRASVTKWGAFMRKTSLDELPQLFNIFVGQMSFIGPRPQQPKEIEPALYEVRKANDPSGFEVRPGLCSYAALKMRRYHDVKRKAEYDSEYVTKFGFWMDFKLFFMAFGVLLGFARKYRGE